MVLAGSRFVVFTMLSLLVGTVVISSSCTPAPPTGEGEGEGEGEPAGIITTVAGTGEAGFSGDGEPATSAALRDPQTIAIDASGRVLIADKANHRVRRIEPDGTIVTIAGSGEDRDFGDVGDGGPATAAVVESPSAIAVDAAGRVLIAAKHRIRRVDVDGTITTIAGSGDSNFSGDGGPATSAGLTFPSGVAVDTSGRVLIADTLNHRIRRVDLEGNITTIAGTGTEGFSGDGGPAISAELNSPVQIVLDTSGRIYVVADPRVRRIDLDGSITTIAGSGEAGFFGDGGPATEALLLGPAAIALDDDGRLFIADAYNHCVRRVDLDSTITTVAGTGCGGLPNGGRSVFSGDGGPATSAGLSYPSGIAVDATGRVFIADSGNHRVRRVDPR